SGTGCDVEDATPPGCLVGEAVCQRAEFRDVFGRVLRVPRRDPALHPDALISLVLMRCHDGTSLLFPFSFGSSLRVPFLPFRNESAAISLNALDQVLNEAELAFQSTKPVLT